MKTTHCLLPFALAAGIACGQTNTAEHFAGTSATISNTLSLAGGAAQGSGSFAHGYSMATGEYSVALGFGAMALHDRSFVWSDVTNPPIFSTAPGQFIVHATNGIFLLGGKVYGDASGLTNIGAGAVLGLGSAALADSAAFASSLQGLRADSALQSDGSQTWVGDQNAAGRVLTNLAGAFVAKVLDQSYIQTNAMVTALILHDVVDEFGMPVMPYYFPFSGSYSGDTTNGFGFITRDSQGNWSFPYTAYDPYTYVGPLDLSGNGGSCTAANCPAAYVVLRDESNNVIGIEITGGSPVDGIYSGDGSYFSGTVYLESQGGGSYVSYSGCSYTTSYGFGNFGDGAPIGTFGFSTYDCPGALFQIDQTTNTTFVPVAQFATNAIPLEVADGRNAWVGEHNGGGFDLVNLGELRAQTVVGNGSGLSNVGLTALDLNAVDTRYLLKQGDRLTGNLTVATIVDQSYAVTNTCVTGLVLQDVSGQSTYSGIEGTYAGSASSGFFGAVSITHDAQWNWGYEYTWYDEYWNPTTTFVSLGNFGTGGAPSGSFWHSGCYLFWNSDYNSYELIWENTEVSILQVTSPVIVQVPQFVTNSVPFEVADGRHAWSGEHNGGGFNLIDVGQLHAQAVVGDGSGLSDVGLSALDLTDVDGRYVRKDGDTVTGNLAVTGTVTADAITVGGRPVATLTFIPQQGDISMGSFTNVPPQP